MKNQYEPAEMAGSTAPHESQFKPGSNSDKMVCHICGAIQDDFLNHLIPCKLQDVEKVLNAVIVLPDDCEIKRQDFVYSRVTGRGTEVDQARTNAINNGVLDRNDFVILLRDGKPVIYQSTLEGK